MPIAPKGHFQSQNALCNLSYSCYRLRHLRHFYFCRVGSDYTVPGRVSKGSDIDRSRVVPFNARISMSEKSLDLEKKRKERGPYDTEYESCTQATFSSKNPG